MDKKSNNVKNKTKKKRSFPPLILAILVLGAAGFAYYYFFHLRKQPEVENLYPPSEEMVSEIESLKNRLETADNDFNDLKTRYDERGQEIARLSQIESEYDELLAKEEERAAVEQEAEDRKREAKKLYDAYNQIDAEDSARILEELITDDVDLVVEIMKNLDPAVAAEILAAMQEKNAADITKRMVL
jgi:flagellar motility protein MotE (MotC chaperone)